MPIDNGIKRFLILKDKGSISDKVFYDFKEIFLPSKMGILMKPPLNLTNFKINNLLAIKI